MFQMEFHKVGQKHRLTFNAYKSYVYGQKSWEHFHIQ
jgi:hypothetical protein